ncbi:MAG: hypothetical protein CMJ81_01620 [Planctomycetaceae bacterium]|nr:hypothetical protein [Planctomycetaceae bacterium]
MLRIEGARHRLCDGISRRSFLQIGGLAMGGLTLPQLLRAETETGAGRSNKSIIMIFLSGGPPHQDMFDLKMNAPVEIRGEFQPISTKVPGVQICEHLPHMAKMMDRLVMIRSLVGSEGRHAAFQCLTGHSVARQPTYGWPSFGSVVSKFQGPTRRAIPPFVSLTPKMKSSTWSDPGQAGFIGQGYAPFAPNQGGGAKLLLKRLTLDRLTNRRALMMQLDRFRSQINKTGVVDGFDAHQEQAFGMLSSSKLAEALDLDREDPQVRERYGGGSLEPAGYGDAGPLTNDYFLAARRLVEAGVRVVSLAYGRWDWHGRPHGTNFENARDHLPRLDQGVTALVDDLDQRGMLDDVSIVVWGEFGRTPRINKKGGRDHWPQVACALLAGGGIRAGQVIGSTNRLGEHAKDRPVHFQEVFATLYHNLGIDINQATVNDLDGRPWYLVDHHRFQPMPELV